MQPLPQTFDFMLGAWNERDPDKIRPLLEQALAPSVIFADPDNYVEGIDAFEEMVRRFRTERPNAVCSRTSGANYHNNRYRYTWLVSLGSKPVLPGMDMVEVDQQDRVLRVDGFFGDVPPL